METKKKWFDDTWVDLGQDILKELAEPQFESKMIGHLYGTKNELWRYKIPTNMRLYYLTNRTWIHKLIEIKWQSYFNGDLDYPETTFTKYLLTQKWSVEFYPDTVETEIKIWFNIRNKILQ